MNECLLFTHKKTKRVFYYHKRHKFDNILKCMLTFIKKRTLIHFEMRGVKCLKIYRFQKKYTILL